MKFCKYKKLLGIPNFGIHTHMFGFALFDLILTIIVVFFITICIKKIYKLKISFSLTFSIILLLFILIGEYLHNVFCIYK